MIILVDGPDGAGKTTLCEKLHLSIPGSTLRHFGAPATPAEADEYWTVYTHNVRLVEHGEVAIFDRSWYSDIVYGPVMRNRLEMSHEHADMLSAMVVASGGGMLIYCTAPVKTLWARCKKRSEDYVPDFDTLVRLHDAYEDVMKNAVRFLPVIRYNTAG